VSARPYVEADIPITVTRGQLKGLIDELERARSDVLISAATLESSSVNGSRKADAMLHSAAALRKACGTVANVSGDLEALLLAGREARR